LDCRASNTQRERDKNPQVMRTQTENVMKVMISRNRQSTKSAEHRAIGKQGAEAARQSKAAVSAMFLESKMDRSISRRSSADVKQNNGPSLSIPWPTSPKQSRWRNSSRNTQKPVSESRGATVYPQSQQREHKNTRNEQKSQRTRKTVVVRNQESAVGTLCAYGITR
jgi:hypothetical protein